MAAYMEPSLLWHLMEEGTATVQQLHELIGVPRMRVRNVLPLLEAKGLVELTCQTWAPDSWSLTPAGITAALAVSRDLVECAA